MASPIFSSALWKTGYILKKLNVLVSEVTKGLVGLEVTYFDINEALRCRNLRKLLYETLLNRESLIYKLGYLKYNSIKNMVINHLHKSKDYGEKLAYIVSLELTLREIFKYINDPTQVLC